MRTSFIVLGWFFAIVLLLVSFFYVTVSNIPNYFPFSRETITGSYSFCSPDWEPLTVTDECEYSCYEKYRVTSHKIEKDVCYCDINNCNP